MYSKVVINLAKKFAHINIIWTFIDNVINLKLWNNRIKIRKLYDWLKKDIIDNTCDNKDMDFYYKLISLETILTVRHTNIRLLNKHYKNKQIQNVF